MRSPLIARLEGTLSEPPRTLRETGSGRMVSTHALLAAAARGSRELSAAWGALRGERVLLAATPGLEWAASFVALLLAGATVVPVPLGAPAPEIAALCEDAGATRALVEPGLGLALPGGVRTRAPVEARGELVAVTDLAGLAQADDVGLLLYTSGTTGRPKGARITHDNLDAQSRVLREAWGFSPSDVLLHVLPMHHLHGVVVAFLTALTTPASIVMAPRFDVATVVRELPGATVFMAVPTMYQRLFDHLDRCSAEEREAFARAARALRLATSGSAALPTTLAERWRALTGAIPLERYGMTEIGMGLSNPLEPSARRPGTVGKPLPTVELRLVDEGGQPTEGPGELWVRGPSVFAGYHERPEATRDAFDDGWFKTGDVGVRDADGYVRLLGRTSVDILKTGGEKVSALEIEEVLREHPAVGEVAVVGVPDRDWGDRVVAVIVLASGAALEPEELRAWAKARLVAYKVPREVRFVAALPRNAMGKVQKKEVAALVGGALG